MKETATLGVIVVILIAYFAVGLVDGEPEITTRDPVSELDSAIRAELIENAARELRDMLRNDGTHTEDDVIAAWLRLDAALGEE